MWKRKELKRRGKRQFLRNWWATVFVCFLLAFTGAEYADSVGFIREMDPSYIPGSEPVVVEQVSRSNWDTVLKWLSLDPGDGAHPLLAAADRSVKPYFDTLTAPFSAFFAFLDRSQFTGWLGVGLAALGVVGGVWFSVWVVGILAVGGRRFLLESRVRDRVSIAAVFCPFGRGRWWNTVKAMLLRSVYLILWSVTVVGPVIKLYSYRMVPFILAENPSARPNEAITLSRQMMKGHKWRCFVIDLTFYLQWIMVPIMVANGVALALGMATGALVLCQYLATVATGLLSLLFVNGYRAATFTQLYVALRQEQLERKGALSHLFTVPAFGEEPVEGPKAWEQAGGVCPPEDPVFHFVQRHELDYGRHYSIRTLVLLFFAFSFIGWTWEVALHIVQAGVFVNRGTMFDPWLPIYGTGGVAVLIVLKRLFRNPPVTFLASMVLCSIIEYWSSWWLEYTKGVRWWDYSNYFMNLNGRICLEGAVVFGLGCCAVIYFAAPLLARQIDRVPPGRQTALCLVLLALYGADGIYSNLHPNIGEGITEGAAAQPAQTVSAPARGAEAAPETAPAVYFENQP